MSKTIVDCGCLLTTYLDQVEDVDWSSIALEEVIKVECRSAVKRVDEVHYRH